MGVAAREPKGALEVYAEAGRQTGHAQTLGEAALLLRKARLE